MLFEPPTLAPQVDARDLLPSLGGDAASESSLQGTARSSAPTSLKRDMSPATASAIVLGAARGNDDVVDVLPR